MKINQIKIGDQVTTSSAQDATVYEVIEIERGGDVRIQEMISNTTGIRRRPSPVWIDCSALQYATIDQLMHMEGV